MSDLMFPKTSGKKKRKKHAKSIMQPDRDKHCYLCMLLHGDYHEKNVEEHHVIPGTWGRQKSEELGLKVYLCVEHHRTGPEAVHRSIEISRVLQQKAQKIYEQTHSHSEWMREVGRNYIKSI